MLPPLDFSQRRRWPSSRRRPSESSGLSHRQGHARCWGAIVSRRKISLSQAREFVPSGVSSELEAKIQQIWPWSRATRPAGLCGDRTAPRPGGIARRTRTPPCCNHINKIAQGLILLRTKKTGRSEAAVEDFGLREFQETPVSD